MTLFPKLSINMKLAADCDLLEIRNLTVLVYQMIYHQTFTKLLFLGKCGKVLKSVISELMLWIKFIITSCEIALSWIAENTSDVKSTLVQIMAWCHQASNHYLSQCWPRSVSPYGVTRPQCMMASSNGSFFLITGPLCREFNGDRWIPFTKGQSCRLWCFFDVGLHNLLNKRSNVQWFETTWCYITSS